ncbi:unnamed protein product, partial [Ectocarpus sp. 12 AP-2014]
PNLSLFYLHLAPPNCAGTIPEALGNLSALESLWLENNSLEGHIPPQLGDLGALKYLYLSNNKLDGEL